MMQGADVAGNDHSVFVYVHCVVYVHVCVCTNGPVVVIRLPSAPPLVTELWVRAGAYLP